MAELLLEVFSEEIPARMQRRAAEDLRNGVLKRLSDAGLDHGEAQAHATPRRLALCIRGLPEAQPDTEEERRGPRVGAPEAAIAGFLKANGLASIAEAEQRDTGKGVFYFAVFRRAGRPTREVLAELLPQALSALPWPKSMLWGAHELRWVRPLHALLCLFDGEEVPFRFGHLTAGGETRGHRFLAPEPFCPSSFEDYRRGLEQRFVLLDAEARKARIMDGLGRLAAEHGLSLNEDAALLEEVAGLVEWPVPMVGRIDPDFMDVPREVLVTSMRSHQKYFSLNGADGKLAPRFALVANMVAEDGGARIVAGNEKVLRARLSDAKFFWDQDRRVRLEDRVARLEDIVFHERLGTMAEKVRRIEELARRIATAVPGADAEEAARAALLAKADLVSGMVGEFPELQGIMGGYYARHDGEGDAVAQAVAEHYAPQGPSDRCPDMPLSICVALADKIDTLVAFFSIGERPTGSKDPFALRRAALGVIRLVVENGLRIDLARIMRAHRVSADAASDPTADLLDFFADRLKVHLREQGTRHDLITAVFALAADGDLVRVLARVRSLQALLASEDGANLLTAYRRAANILRIEEKKDGARHAEMPDPLLLQAPEEQALFDALNEAAGRSEAALAHEEFATACQALAGLRHPVDAFFDRVTVNADDPALRANRLRLLSRIRASLDRVADFSRIEG
ncbi:MAG: glycine--tRNA ligase subunit beta [Alphaproteobacteria bacterium]|nr:glycine--tRNA ligase subunit beta [Alphaproteobacteria bacterium]